MRIVFFGTPQFAATILTFLLEKKIEVAAVITRPDKPRGRSAKPQSSPVKELALKQKLPLYQPQKASDPEFASFLKTLDADVFVVAAYAEILKENVLQAPKIFCINVHGSLLPKYRGAAPIQRTVMAGEKETGVTIMKMAKELDAGAILKMEKVPIPEDMTAGELTEILSQVGAKALWETLKELEEKGRIPEYTQNSAEATYAKKVQTEDAKVLWNKSSEEIYNQIRGVTPKPGAWCIVKIRGEPKRLLIKKAKKHPSIHGKPGEILSKNGRELIVACQTGAVQLLEIQLEGKKEMAVEIFLRGISLSDIQFEMV